MNYALPARMVAEAVRAFDAALENWGKDCTLHFPRTRSECPNCELNTADGTSAGVYKAGGPTDFPAGTVCPVCAGEGFVGSAETLALKMRVHENPAEWVGKIPANTPDGTIQTRFALNHYAAARSAGKMTIDEEAYRDRTYELWGDPVDEYGILKGHYVVCWWRRS